VQGFFPSTDLILTGSTCTACRLAVQSASIAVSGRGPIESDAATATPTVAATAVPTATATPTPSEQEPWLEPAPGRPEETVEGIPTLSELGMLLMMVAMAGSAVVVLLRNRR
jgi:hypothetical protein